MPLLPRFISLWRNFWNKNKVEQELNEELQSYLEILIEEKIKKGINPKDAQRQALIEMGGAEQIKEKVREVRIGYYLETLWQDLRYSLRMLLKNPAFVFTVIITMALGIGANTALFSLINAALLNPLPLSESEQLMMIYTETPNDSWGFSSYPDLIDWRNESHSFSDLSAITDYRVNLTGQGEPSRVVSGYVSANFFKLLRVEAAIGRTFIPGEDIQGAEPVIVLSHTLWQNQFGADPKLIGQTLNINGQFFTVIGVLPKDFYFHWGDFQAWIPIQYHPTFSLDRKEPSTVAIGRLKASVTPAQARIEMAEISHRLATQYPDTNKERGVMIIGLKDQLIDEVSKPLMITFGATILVLLIACANMANLFLARSITRQKEIALRLALGASRWRITQQLLTESILIALLGGLLGLSIGLLSKELILYSSSILSPMRQSLLPPGMEVKLDFRMLSFTFIVTVLVGIILGLVTALRVPTSNVNEVLKEGGKTASEGSGNNRWRNMFVVSQIAFTLVLLICSGLLVKSFRVLMSVNPGFDASNVLTVEYELPEDRYPEIAQQWAFHQKVVERIRTFPGVIDASAIVQLPYTGRVGIFEVVLLDRPEPPKDQAPRAQFNRVDPYYFQTMKIPLISGRVFTEQDKIGTLPVVIINQAMAERYWPGQDVVGKSLRIPDSDSVAQIVGVVGNIKYYNVDEPIAQIYLAFAQFPGSFARLVVRTTGSPLTAINSVKQAVWQVDKDQPLWRFRTLESLFERSIGSHRFVMYLLSVFSLVSVLLAIVGIYGVISYSVNQRTHEIGIRMALGAQWIDIIKLVVGYGAALILIGIAIGLVGALALTHYIKVMLFNVEATDISTYCIVSLLLALVALLACYLPARRATKVDPMISLRHQ